MPYRIVVEEMPSRDVEHGAPDAVKIYEQAVEALDLKRVMEAVNWKPRGPRKPKEQK